MWKIGHRGACGYALENTLDSFKKAIDFAVDAIELDVHVSADNDVVVIHDATVDRTTTASGLVHLKSTSELQLLGIPTLSDVLDLIKNQCVINIELKTKAATVPTLQLLEKRINAKKNSPHNFLISSFDWDILAQIASKYPELQLGILYEVEQLDAIALAKSINAFSVHPHYKLLTFENVKSMQSFGFKVCPWTVNEHEAINRLKSWNVDGIISDFPDRL